MTPGVYVPSVRVKVVPVPFVQFAPLLVLYCQVAPVSMLLTLTVTMLVMLSVADAPESVCSVNLGARGAVVSSVMAAVLLVAVPRLPARSVCLTLI